VAKLSQHKLTPSELHLLEDVFKEDLRLSTLRLREGEYQYNLAKAIASFELELNFPDVKEIVNKLYGEEKTNDVQFIRKIQTILKKMEKSNIVRILPKKRPWELQRYALLSLKFQDAENNVVSLATKEEVGLAQDRLQTALNQQESPLTGWRSAKGIIYVFTLSFVIVAAYAAIVWDVVQPIVSPVVFVSAFFVSITSSVLLGKMLSRS
jgi:hypothetical protein